MQSELPVAGDSGSTGWPPVPFRRTSVQHSPDDPSRPRTRSMDMIRIDAPAELDMPIGEAMFTQRAIRRLDSSRPISEANMKVVLDAASKAPSGGNTQPARFLVVRSKESIREFGKLYHEAWWAKRRDEYGWTNKADIPAGSVYEMPSRLADEIVDAPAIILALSVGGSQAAHSVFPPGAESSARSACARYWIGPDDAASTSHGARVLDVRDSSRG